MTRIDTKGLEIKNIFVGLYKYQIEALDDLRSKHGRSRADIIREAVDLLLKGISLKDSREREKDIKDARGKTGS